LSRRAQGDLRPGVRRKRFDHDDDCFDAFSSASQHEPRQTRIGSLDIRRMQDRRLAFRGGRRGTPNETPWEQKSWNPGPMPQLPESAAAKVKKKSKSMTHRRIEVPSSETICRTAKKLPCRTCH
jgi:hypothetical protein